MKAEGTPIAATHTVLDRATLSSAASDEMIRWIIGGRYGPGDSLPSEGALAAGFQVSRQVVRESLQRLANAGLITTRQGKQASVTPRATWNEFAPEVLEARRATGQLDDMLLEVLELRRMIEIEAAGLAAIRATEDDREAMQANVLRMDALIDNPRLYAQADLDFHQSIMTATSNRLLPTLFIQLRPLLGFAREISAISLSDVRGRSQSGHRAIFEAIVAGAAPDAERAMMDHLSWTANLHFEERSERLRQSRRLAGRAGASGDEAAVLPGRGA